MQGCGIQSQRYPETEAMHGTSTCIRLLEELQADNYSLWSVQCFYMVVYSNAKKECIRTQNHAWHDVACKLGAIS